MLYCSTIANQVAGIIKYIADVVLLYFEAVLGKYSLLLFRDEIYKQYMLTCPNLYNGALSGSIQGIIHYKQDMIFLQVFILRSMLIHIILYIVQISQLILYHGSHYSSYDYIVMVNLYQMRGFDLKESLWSGSLTFQQAVSTAATNLDGNLSGKKFASYTVFKGKAALSIHPILPSFSKLESGGSRVSKNGSVMLTFFPAVGQRKYDYTKKQLFALSPTEVGSLISLGPAESCEFFHDPSMKSSNEGTVKKSLSITPLGSDSGYFVNITVVNSAERTNDRLSVPITKAEFAVIRTTLS
ncbi:hypothetical protein ACJX0J_022809, partial [Zea mays]